jgi:hypothetical protein
MQLYFVFHLHFSVTIATQVSPCYSRGVSSRALIHNVILGLPGLANILCDSSKDGFALVLC